MKKLLSRYTYSPFLLFHGGMFAVFLVLFVWQLVLRERYPGQGAVGLALLGLLFVGALVIMDLVFLLKQRQQDYEEQQRHEREHVLIRDIMLRNMSRDVRTPMNAIIGLAEISLQQETDPAQMTDNLIKIQSSATHILSLVDDMIDLEHLANGELLPCEETVNLPRMMNHLMNLTYSMAKARNQTVSLDINYLEAVHVVCDRHILERILIDVTNNAIARTTDGGRIDVGVVQLEDDATEDDVEDTDKGQKRRMAMFEFYVMDRGPGLSEDRIRQLTGKTSRTKAAVSTSMDDLDFSMGVINRLVHLLGGYLDVESDEGQGMQVYITFELPIVEDIAAPSEELARSTDFSGKRALVVDDIMINRRIAAAILNLYGMEVEEASDGGEAVAAMQRVTPGYYDLILMDIQMPHVDGYEATRRIRKLSDSVNASVPILAMSANVFDEDKKLAYEAGIDGYLSKPVDKEQILETISDILYRKDK